MSNPTHTPADIALAAWKAAGIKPDTLRMYRLRWTSWETWCDANGIDPLGATHDDYTAFQADHKYKTLMRAKHASALFHPYRHVGKPSPAHRPPSQNRASKQSSDPIVKLYECWCKDNGTTTIPAPPQDVVSFLTELAKTHPKSYLKQASKAIGALHTMAGYAPPSREPEVTSALKHLNGTPRQLVTDTEGSERRNRRIAQWTDWCRGQGFEPADATAEHFLQFLKLLATTSSADTLKIRRYEIANMYVDRSITHNSQTDALIEATPPAGTRRAEHRALRKQADAEIALILQTEADLMEEQSSHLPSGKRERIARAMAHADITDQTLLRYVRYAWLPFKEWCKTNGTSPETATPGDVSAFLCEIADEAGPTFACATLDGLNHVFNRIRPYDNPAKVASVRKTVRGLKRERPSPPQQATPIGTEDLAILIKTAHNPRPRELEDRRRHRAAVDIALLCTMHDSAIRAEEAANAKWDDLHNAPDGRGGSVLTIRSSKTDQLHEGAVQYLTKFTTDAINHMKAVRQELGIADKEDDRIFRLNAQSIYRRIRAACKFAKLQGRYTAHSLRVGSAQDLLTENFSDAQIMHHHRWRSQASLNHYTKATKAEKNAVAQREQRRKQDGHTRKPKHNNYGIKVPHNKARLGQ